MGEDGEGTGFSAFEFDILREAFRKSVAEMNLPQEHWRDHAKRLYREMSDEEPDESMIAQIIGH